MSPALQRVMVAIFALALGVRVLCLIEQPTFPTFFQPEVDARYYDDAARWIASEGPGFGSQVLLGSPAYPYFLGAVRVAFGPGPWPPRVAQIVLGLVLVWCVWDTARRVLGSWWAPLPSALAAFYGPLIFFEGQLLEASLEACVHAVLMWTTVAAMQRAGRTPGAGPWVGVGAAWGVTCLVRPGSLVLFGALAYAVWVVESAVTARTRLGWIAAVACTGALAMVPLVARNVARTETMELMPPDTGIQLYVGNGPTATGTWRTPDDVPDAESAVAQFTRFAARAEQALGRRLSVIEVDHYWRDRTSAAVRDEPLRWCRVLVRKLHLLWNGRELPHVYDYEFWREVSLVLGPPLVEFVHIAPFALVGTFMLLAQAGVGRFLGVYVLALASVPLLTYVTGRGRLALVAPLLVVAASFVRGIVARLRASSWRTAVGWCAVLGAVLFVAIPVPVASHREASFHALGASYLRLGQTSFAEWALLKSLAHDRSYLPSHWGLVDLYERRGLRQFSIHHLDEIVGIARHRGDGATVARARAEKARLSDERTFNAATRRPVGVAGGGE